MDLNSILGWSVTLLAIAGLIVFVRVRNQNREKRAVSVLKSFARENNCTVSTYDHWDKTLIGIDGNETNKLIFIRTIPEKEIRSVIDLSEAIDCRMAKSQRTIKNDKETVNAIERIEVVISFYGKKEDLALEFYNNDYDKLVLTGELQLAQKWTGIIKSMISANQSRKATVKGRIQVRQKIDPSEVNLNHVAVQGRKNKKNSLKEAHPV